MGKKDVSSSEAAHSKLHQVSFVLRRCLLELDEAGVQAQLRKFGIKTLSRNEIEKLMPQFYPMDLQPVLNRWSEEVVSPLALDQELFLLFAVTKLWMDWFPDRPCDMGMMLLFGDGFDFVEIGEFELAIRVWDRFFESLELRLQKAHFLLEDFHVSTGIREEELTHWLIQYLELKEKALKLGSQAVPRERILRVGRLLDQIQWLEQSSSEPLPFLHS